MIDWEEQQQWTVGDIIRKMREEAKIGLEQLSRGLCSVATLSRICLLYTSDAADD